MAYTQGGTPTMVPGRIHPVHTHPGRIPRTYPPREDTLYIPTQGGYNLVYTHHGRLVPGIYPPWEAYRAIYTPNRVPREAYWAIYTLIHPREAYWLYTPLIHTLGRHTGLYTHLQRCTREAYWAIYTLRLGERGHEAHSPPGLMRDERDHEAHSPPCFF